MSAIPFHKLFSAENRLSNATIKAHTRTTKSGNVVQVAEHEDSRPSALSAAEGWRPKPTGFHKAIADKVNARRSSPKPDKDKELEEWRPKDDEVEHKGSKYHYSGKKGRNMKTGKRTAQYEEYDSKTGSATGRRVWKRETGEVDED